MSGSDGEATLDKTISSPFQDLFTRGGDGLIDSVKFENEIHDEVVEIAKRLKETEPALVPEAKPPQIFFIAIAALDQKKIEAPVFQHGELLTADNFTNVRGVSDAGDFFRQIGFIMAAGEWREIVCLATRTVVYRLSEQFSKTAIPLKVDPDTLDKNSPREFAVRPLSLIDLDAVSRRTSISVKQLGRINDELIGSGYYDHSPLLAPRFDPEVASGIGDKYGKFSGEGGWTISPETASAFIDQFPPKLREEAADLLLSGTFLDKSELVSKVCISIDRMKAKVSGKSFLVPLSASSGGDVWSGAMKSFCTDDQLSATASLSSALKECEADDQILFVDDNAASGTQSCAQLYAYCLNDRADWPEEYRDEDALYGALRDDEIEKLKHVSFGIAVAVGHEASIDRLRNTCSQLGFTNFKGVEWAERIGESAILSPELSEFMCKVGSQLFAMDRYRKEFTDLGADERSKCEEFAFGYSGLRGLTVNRL